MYQITPLTPEKTRNAYRSESVDRNVIGYVHHYRLFQLSYWKTMGHFELMDLMVETINEYLAVMIPQTGRVSIPFYRPDNVTDREKFSLQLDLLVDCLKKVGWEVREYETAGNRQNQPEFGLEFIDRETYDKVTRKN